MIAGIFHEGSGLGNQLHRYVATRVLALDKGYEWGMLFPENFKGKDFMNLELPNKEIVNNSIYNFGSKWGGALKKMPFVEKQVKVDGIDLRPYDPEINFVEDNTMIDGEFQDPRYFEHRLPEINEWLKVESIDIPDDVCVIGFRGGEYVGVPGLFLGNDYWSEAIDKMLEINPNMKFEVHTDDPATAEMFFSFPVIHDIRINWRSMRYAKHAIIANSSFYILPRLLSGGMTIAPKYWAGHNKGFWQLPQNYYKQFKYI